MTFALSNGHPHYLQLPTTTDSGMNSHVLVLLWTCGRIFWTYAYEWIVACNLIKHYQIWTLLSVRPVDPISPSSCQHLALSAFLIFAYLIWVKWYLNVVLICILQLLMSCNISLYSIRAILNVSSVNYLFISFTHFFN